MDPLRTQRDSLTRANLLEIADSADRHLAQEAVRVPALAEPIGVWRGELARLPDRLRSAEARVAFVGAVKSGKSTLVNALLGEDLLPRGSGILTAQVTEVRSATQPRLHLSWHPRSAVNRAFSTHLTALGHPGEWRLEVSADRERARALLAGGASRPERAAVRALLGGYDEVGHRLGDRPREEHQEDLSTLSSWAARDEIAVFLAGLRVDVPAPDLPPGIALLDCQGSDAWNAAHGEAVESALLGAHALVYVISSRVGLREADHRLLGTLGNLGLLELTRFVLNVDLGEVRSGADLERVVSSVGQALGELGCTEGPWVFSCLQGLLDRRVLLSPETVSPGERRLLEAWESAAAARAAGSRDCFEAFRSSLWSELRAERERLVILRGRTALRRVLVEASQALRAHGQDATAIERASWKADAVDRILAWARQRMEDAARQEKARLRQAVEARFSASRAPQRRLWEDRVACVSDPVPAGGDAAAAAAVLGARLEGVVEGLLAESEPLRINAVRNLALEARGALARTGEALGGETATLLARAGVTPGPPPGRVALAGEISVTRKIPVLRGRILRRRNLPPDRARRIANAVGRWAAAPLRRRARAGDALDRAGVAAQRTIVLRRARSAWQEYVGALLETCLLPHVDDVAAQIYGAVAAWVLAETGSGLGKALETLAASHPRDLDGRRPVCAPEPTERRNP